MEHTLAVPDSRTELHTGPVSCPDRRRFARDTIADLDMIAVPDNSAARDTLAEELLVGPACQAQTRLPPVDSVYRDWTDD